MNMNKFATFISYLTVKTGYQFEEYQIDTMANYISSLMPETQKNYVDAEVVNTLIKSMSRDGQKIEAIKAYRTLTGLGLKESKDIVEKYWMVPVPKPEGA